MSEWVADPLSDFPEPFARNVTVDPENWRYEVVRCGLILFTSKIVPVAMDIEKQNGKIWMMDFAVV